jgi:hypothetical protein
VSAIKVWAIAPDCISDGQKFTLPGWIHLLMFIQTPRDTSNQHIIVLVILLSEDTTDAVARPINMKVKSLVRVRVTETNPWGANCCLQLLESPGMHLRPLVRYILLQQGIKR